MHVLPLTYCAVFVLYQHAAELQSDTNVQPLSIWLYRRHHQSQTICSQSDAI